MRVVFAGTPEFARLALQAILRAGHPVPLVLTQPDRPSGRGMKLKASPVKQCALQANIPVLQPQSLKLDGKYGDQARQAQLALQAAEPDVMVVAAYGLILPKWVLGLPKFGCLNIHASLLPRWRGAAPIQRAIEAGDAQTGITIMQMDEGLDTGAMVSVWPVPIRNDHTAASLHDDLALLGGKAIVAALDDIQHGRAQATPQPEDGVTYAAKLSKAEAMLDLSLPARQLERRVRAFNPFPGAAVRLPGRVDAVKVWSVQALPGPTQPAAPGTLVSATVEGIDLATGEGVLRLLELQKPGGKRQTAGQFIQGWQP
jgi:methionyl-tRNA formyltransferase